MLIRRCMQEHQGNAGIAESNTSDEVCANEDTDATAHDRVNSAVRSTTAMGCVNEDTNATGYEHAADVEVNTLEKGKLK